MKFNRNTKEDINEEQVRKLVEMIGDSLEHLDGLVYSGNPGVVIDERNYHYFLAEITAFTGDLEKELLTVQGQNLHKRIKTKLLDMNLKDAWKLIDIEESFKYFTDKEIEDELERRKSLKKVEYGDSTKGEHYL